MSCIYIKQNLNQKWRKHYLNGEDVSRFNQGNNWKAHSKIEWNTFEELAEQLNPFIEGKEANAEYCALMIGKTANEFERLKANVEDEDLDYLLLDIETDLPQYEFINTDLNKIRNWLISHYDWIEEDTGMFLFFSNSAGVHCADKHKQIRARAIIKIDKALNEQDRLHLLDGYTKKGTKHSKEFNHIDAATLRRATASIIAPPLIEQTETNGLSASSLSVEGNPVTTAKVVAGFIPTNDAGGETTRGILSKQTNEWFNQIEKGDTYEPVWKTVWSSVMRCESRRFWEEKITNKCKEIGSDRWKEIPSEYRKANTYIRKWFFLHDLSEKDTKHNFIKLEEKYISEEGLINWKKNGTIHIKSGTGTGKTTALKKLLKDNPDKTILYIGKNVGYVRNAAATLGLEDYKDEKLFPRNEIHYRLYASKRLAICYPSLHHLHLPNGWELAQFDIVIIDEARQLLGFSATADANILPDKHNAATIMGDLVANAELVVCCDADLDDLTIQAIEIHRGDDECFDIYHNTFTPLKGKVANICRSPAEIMSLATQLAKAGKRFAIVGDLSPKGTTKYPIARIEELLKLAGLESNEIFTLHGFNSHEGEQQDLLCNPNKYLTEKLKNGLKAFIASPSLTSGWDFSESEYKFDYVLGFYPHAILTAPEILQQLRRFRATNDFYVWIKPNNQHTGYELEKLEDIWEDIYGYTASRFKEPVFEDGLQQEKEAFIKRETIKRKDTTGLDHRFREVTKASKASLCNLKLHFDLLWKEQGGNTQLSKYFDDNWKEGVEGKETISKDKKELTSFYELSETMWDKIRKEVSSAKDITKEEYEKLITEH